MSKMKYCPNCGSEALERDKFCGKCGTKLSPSPPQDIEQHEEWFNRGAKLYEAGDYKQAIEIYKRALKYKADDIDTLLNIGSAYTQLRDNKNALVYCDRVIKINPNNRSAWFNKGMANFYRGDYDEAIKAYKRVLEITPDDPQVKALIANSINQKEFISHLNLDNENYPKEARDLLRKVVLFFQEGNFEEGTKIVQEALKIAPNMAEGWMLLGTFYSFKRSQDEAKEALEKALKLNPKMELAWSNLGMVYDRLQNYDKAIECYDEALRINPDFSSAWTNKGLAYDITKKYQEALECYDKSIKLNPYKPSVWMNKALTLKKIGNLESAQECYMEALKINPYLEAAKEAVDEIKHLLSVRRATVDADGKHVIRTVIDGTAYCQRCGKKNYVKTSHCAYCGGPMERPVDIEKLEKGDQEIISPEPHIDIEYSGEEYVNITSSALKQIIYPSILYGCLPKKFTMVMGVIAGKLEFDELSIDKTLLMARGDPEKLEPKVDSYVKMAQFSNEELKPEGKFVCGWYCSIPSDGMFFSDANRRTQITYQKIFSQASFIVVYPENLNFNRYSDVIKAYRLKDLDSKNSFMDNWTELGIDVIDQQDINLFLKELIRDYSELKEKIQESLESPTELKRFIENKWFIFNISEEEKKEFFKELIQADDDVLIENLMKEAEKLIYDGSYEKVLEICTKVIKTHSNSVPAWFWRGKALSALARDEEAVNCYVMANKLSGGWITASSNLMRTQSAVSSKEARLMMRKMERKPQHTGYFPTAESWNAQGAYTQTLGQFEDALYCFEQSLKIDENFLLAKRNKERVIRLLKAEGLYEPDKESRQREILKQLDVDQAKAITDIESMLNREFELVKKVKESGTFDRGDRLEIVIKENKVKEIAIVEIDLPELPESIGNLIHLERLICTGRFGEKLSNTPKSLSRLKSLKELNLKSNNLNDISEINGLKDLENLERLNLSANGISEIKGLESLKQLETLDLSFNKLTEIKGLDSLHKLFRLKLDHNQITEIKSLDNLKNLTELAISFNKLREIKGLENLSNLWWITIYANKFPKELIESIGKDGVYDDGKKYVDYCRRNYIESHNLKNEYVVVNDIKYYVWENMLRIQKIGLKSIDDIGGLEKLQEIEILNLSDNNISTIKGLGKLEGLKELYLSGNQIKRIENLEKLTSLTVLELASNEISEIKNLDLLVNLKRLDLSSNEISEVEGLDKLTNLKKLHLSHNKISRVKGLGNLRELSYLSMHADWEEVKRRIGNQEFEEMGIKNRGYTIQNPQKVVEYCQKLS